MILPVRTHFVEIGSQLAEYGPMLAEFSQIWSNTLKFGRTPPEFDHTWSVHVGRNRPRVVETGSDLIWSKPVANFDEFGTDFFGIGPIVFRSDACAHEAHAA